MAKEAIKGRCSAHDEEHKNATWLRLACSSYSTSICSVRISDGAHPNSNHHTEVPPSPTDLCQSWSSHACCMIVAMWSITSQLRESGGRRCLRRFDICEKDFILSHSFGPFDLLRATSHRSLCASIKPQRPAFWSAIEIILSCFVAWRPMRKPGLSSGLFRFDLSLSPGQSTVM